MHSGRKKELIRLKVCVIGNHDVGKTNLIRVLTNASEEAQGNQYQIYLYCAEANNFSLQVQLWDCGDHINFHKYLRHAYFRDASAALLLFDISQSTWKEDAHKWISQAYEHQCYLVYAIAMNSDLLEKKSIKLQKQALNQKLKKGQQEETWEEAHAFFHKYDIKLSFYERGPKIKDQFRDLFVKMYDEFLVVSRGSMARGLHTLEDDEEGIHRPSFFDKE